MLAFSWHHRVSYVTNFFGTVNCRVPQFHKGPRGERRVNVVAFRTSSYRSENNSIHRLKRALTCDKKESEQSWKLVGRRRYNTSSYRALIAVQAGWETLLQMQTNHKSVDPDAKVVISLVHFASLWIVSKRPNHSGLKGRRPAGFRTVRWTGVVREGGKKQTNPKKGGRVGGSGESAEGGATRERLTLTDCLVQTH
jgi:hypothetical protein